MTGAINFPSLRKRPVSIPATIIVSALLIGGVIYDLYHSRPQATTHIMEPLIAVPQASPAKPVVDLAISMGRRAEGREHVFIRELIANPSIADFTGNPKDKFTGNLADKAAVKTWAGREAHILAIKAGYIGRNFHEEIRTRHPNKMAYVIEKNPAGGLRVVEYLVSKNAAGVSSLTQVAVHSVAKTLASSHFIGPQDGTTDLHSPYDYMFVPS